MILFVSLLLPVLLGAWNLLLSLSFFSILLSCAGVAFCAIGVVRRGERLVTAGLFSLVIGYGGGLVSSRSPPQLWTGLAYGLAVFLTLELGFYGRRMGGWRGATRLHPPRLRYLAIVTVSAVVGGFLLSLLAVGLAPWLTGRPVPLIFWVGGIGVVTLAVASAAMLRFWIRDDR